MESRDVESNQPREGTRARKDARKNGVSDGRKRRVRKRGRAGGGKGVGKEGERERVGEFERVGRPRG